MNTWSLTTQLQVSRFYLDVFKVRDMELHDSLQPLDATTFLLDLPIKRVYSSYAIPTEALTSTITHKGPKRLPKQVGISVDTQKTGNIPSYYSPAEVFFNSLLGFFCDLARNYPLLRIYYVPGSINLISFNTFSLVGLELAKPCLGVHPLL